jgi:hypothetical protein
LTALPGARGEAEDFDLHAATFQRARQNIGRHRSDGDRPAAHRARIVDQQRHDRVAEHGVALAFIRKRHGRVGDDARKARSVERAFLKIEFPGAVLMRQQAALQPVGEAPDHALQALKLLVEMVAQARQFVRIAQIVGLDDLVEFGREGAIGLLVDGISQIVRRPPALAGSLGPVLAHAVGVFALVFLAVALAAVFAGRFARFGTHHRFGRRLLARIFGLALLARIVARIVVLVRILVGLGRLALLLAQLQILDQLARGFRRRSLDRRALWRDR